VTGCTVHQRDPAVDARPDPRPGEGPDRPGETPTSPWPPRSTPPSTRSCRGHRETEPPAGCRLSTHGTLGSQAGDPAGAAEAADTRAPRVGLGEWSLLEDAIAKRAWIVGIFADEAAANEGWRAQGLLLARRGEGPPSPRLPDSDWKNSYREHFKAWTFGRLHWVPVWERETFRLPAGPPVLWLDPGMAFGTGNHETTRLCIERLVEFEAALPGAAAGLRVVDAGCGSGILALSASAPRLPTSWASTTTPEAVRVSIENAELNGLVSRGALRDRRPAEGLMPGTPTCWPISSRTSSCATWRPWPGPWLRAACWP
jgi:hypothetical protein